MSNTDPIPDQPALPEVDRIDALGFLMSVIVLGGEASKELREVAKWTAQVFEDGAVVLAEQIAELQKEAAGQAVEFAEGGDANSEG